MFSNKITTIIISLLLGLIVFSSATDAATTTTYSGVTTTNSGVTTTYSGTTTTYSGVTTASSGLDKVENVTNTVKPTIPVATVTEKASQTSTSTPSKNTAGFEVVLTIMTLSALWFKLKRK